MAYVIKIAGLAGISHDQNRSDRDIGLYVREYDPTRYDGRGLLRLTKQAGGAKRFSDMTAAFTYWRQSYGTRRDGQPNRPLTAYSVEIVPAPEAAVELRHDG